MNSPSPEFSPYDDSESELFNADEYPWDASWEEPALLFEALESGMIGKPLPSREELLALDRLTLPGEAEVEDWDDFASGDY